MIRPASRAAGVLRSLRLRLYSAWVRRRFRSLESLLDPRVDFTNPQFVSIGAGTTIHRGTWIYAICNDGARKAVFEPSIEIGSKCIIGRNGYITCTNRLVIEDGAFIMSSVLITDTIHGYYDPEVPIVQQPVVSRGPVVIGSGSWIGVGACIIGSVRIGRNSVVGANAVVTRDVPDLSVVGGVPARLVKQYDPAREAWVHVEDNES